MTGDKSYINNPLLECRNLSCGFHEKNITTCLVKPFSAEVFQNELVCLIGVNGAGKSTLLKTILNLQTPINGEILIEGKKIQSQSQIQLAHKIGAALSNTISEQFITLEELVALGRYPYTGLFGRLNRKDKNLVEKYIRLVKVTDKKHQQFYSLSDGEKQKAIIAKILSQETPLILLDEPTAHLDIPNRIHIFNLLRELASHQQKGIVITTHNLELAMQLSDKIWLIDNEGNMHINTPEDLVLSGKLHQVFSNEKIDFDNTLMQFRVKQTFRELAFLSGANELFYSTKNLLGRYSIGVTDSMNKAGFKIELKNNPLNIILKRANDMHIFSSFAALQNFLRLQQDE